MGCSDSAPRLPAEQSNDAPHSEPQLVQGQPDHEPGVHPMRVLVLGSPRAGKSTLINTMLRLCGEKYNARINRYATIHKTALECLAILVQNVDKQGVELADSDMKREANFYLSKWRARKDCAGLDPEDEKELWRLWENPDVKKCYLKCRDRVLNETNALFLADISNVGDFFTLDAEEDKPITQKYVIPNKRLPLSVYYAGREFLSHPEYQERLGLAQGIVYVVSAAEYDVRLSRNPVKNRLLESVEEFRQLASHPNLSYTCLSLYITKIDKLDYKLKHCPMSKLPEFNYHGRGGTDDVLAFILSLFPKQTSQGDPILQFTSDMTCLSSMQNQLQTNLVAIAKKAGRADEDIETIIRLALSGGQ
ncbi:guanine nucleotide-binding protein G(i) subunit alpha-like [Sycon ciliatum]|uniref:guanine nucleotide-binding protein G(i) subunit alpha-like n=1 Tax=Sycon ciliatum TaxID=27933 RepID=UPI0020AA9098|eukprot:scpid65161/ scgid17327/ Guanine nucleotide-binding protein alpha-4 subunit